MEKILVSICCITYNQEEYIADAIEGFIKQKTNFKYEILIHDDASTDKTAEIIRKYELKHPDLIKSIFQSENQYSKGVKVVLMNINRSKGKYLAVCEGDDYWTDQYKLQKQVDYLETHPECSLCVHAAYRIEPNKHILSSQVRPNIGDKLYTVDEVIKGGGGLFPTASMLFPAKHAFNLPDFFNTAPVGDYPLVIYLSLQGPVYFIDECMSAYRVNIPGSWSSRHFFDADKIVEHFRDIARMLDKIDQYSDYKYQKTIEQTKMNNEFNTLLDLGLYNEAKKDEYRQFYKDLGLKRKSIIFIKKYLQTFSKRLLYKGNLKHAE